MSETITWSKGYRAKVKAEIAHRELEKLREKNGSLTAGLVLLEASKARSPLHKAFEWDNGIAAEEYRLEQARRMLRSIEITYVELPKTPLRQYEIVTQPAKNDTPERKVYEPVEKIMKDPVLRDELLGRAIRDAISYRKKYHALSELSQVFAELDSFLVENKASV